MTFFKIKISNWLFFITQSECVYCAVRTENLYVIQVNLVFKVLGGDFNVVFECRWLFCYKADNVYTVTFLGAFVKWRQATFSVFISVSPSDRMEQLGSHWRDFDENWYLSIFRQSFVKIQSDMKTYVYLGQYLAQLFLEWEMFQTEVLENIKTHFAFSANYYFLENHTVYEIKWKNIVEPGRPQMTIWRIRIACWISKATKTHSQYEIRIDFPLQQLMHERASLLCYTYIACLVCLS